MPTCPSGHESSAGDYCDVCGVVIAGNAAPGQPAGQPSGQGRFPGPPPAPPPGAGERCPEPSCGAPRTGRFCEECGYDYATGTPGFGPSSAAVPPGSGATYVPGSGAAYAPGTGAAVPGTGGYPGPGPAGPGPGGYYGSTAGGSYPSTAGGMGPGGGGPTGTGWHAVVAADRAYYETVIAQGGPDATRIAFPPYAPERRFPLVGREVRIGRRSRSRGLTPEIDLSGNPEDPGVSHLHAVLIAQQDGTWAVFDPGSANGTKINEGADPISANVTLPVHDGDRIYLGAWTVITIRKGDVP